jgi:hypothetical protein
LFAFAEFSLFLLLSAYIVVIIIGLPNFATVVLVAKSVIVDNKIVVPAGRLSRFILISAHLLEDALLLFDLQWL